MKKAALPAVVLRTVVAPRVVALAVAVFTAASLVACAPASESNAGANTELNIVASTNVYSSIAEAVAGTHARVTGIITSPAQDPHSFEASARVQLELSRADIVIANGGGYDDFVDMLLAGSANNRAIVISAVEVSGFSAQQIAENEHVWFNLTTATAVADRLADALAKLDPSNAAAFKNNARGFASSIATLSDRVAAIALNHGGSEVLVTEPVPLYLLADAGLVNETPRALSTAIENGNGVPPAALNEAIELLQSGKVALLVFNEQTAGPETTQLLSVAKEQRIPSLAVTETLPPGISYLEWMSANIQAIEQALS